MPRHQHGPPRPPSPKAHKKDVGNNAAAPCATAGTDLEHPAGLPFGALVKPGAIAEEQRVANQGHEKLGGVAGVSSKGI